MMSIFLFALAPVASADVFLGPEIHHALVSTNVTIQGKVLDELELAIGGVGRRNIEARMDRLADVLGPMFDAAPKNTDGAIRAPTARYALDRLFVQLHGWHVKGLRLVGEAWAGTSPTLALVNLATSEVQNIFETRFNAHGLTLHELVVLAALLEDLVYSEADVRLRAVYDAMGYPRTGILTKSQASTAIDAFMASFILGLNVSDLEPQVLKAHCSAIGEAYPTWPETQEFMRGVQSELSPTKMDFQGMLTVLEAISERYGTWQRSECQSIKDRLTGLEDSFGSGRVPLRHFYGSLESGVQWFTESVQFLRQSGALDESDPAAMSVIIPNYISSPTNCVASSNFYAVCCPDECEGILAILEGRLGEPTAMPVEIVALVEDYLFAVGNETISASLVDRLDDVAEYHGGRVPLHGRLFAQWLHHVFPRDCPYPHVSGTTRPLLMADWEADSGESAIASEEEVRQHLSSRRTSFSTGKCEATWSMDEELLEPDARRIAAVVAADALGMARLDRILLLLATGAVVIVAAASLAGVLAPLMGLWRTCQVSDTVYSL